MKKIRNFIIDILVMCIAIFTLCSCGKKKEMTVEEYKQHIEKKELEKEMKQNDNYNKNLREIENKIDLYYDYNTMIVYYYSATSYSANQAYGYMCPYYSENGLMCKYNLETKEIEEIWRKKQ